MPSCTSCGNQLEDSSKFCTACGTPRTIGAAVAPPQRMGLGVKIVLGIVGLFVVLVVAGVGIISVTGLKLHKVVSAEVGTYIDSDRNVRTHASFDVDANAIAKDLGLAVYPGKKTAIEFGGNDDKSIAFRTSDAIDKVDSYYRQLPSATVRDDSPKQRTFVVSTAKGLVTVRLEASQDGTIIRHSRPEKD